MKLKCKYDKHKEKHTDILIDLRFQKIIFLNSVPLEKNNFFKSL